MDNHANDLVSGSLSLAASRDEKREGSCTHCDGYQISNFKSGRNEIRGELGTDCAAMALGGINDSCAVHAHNMFLSWTKQPQALDASNNNKKPPAVNHTTTRKSSLFSISLRPWIQHALQAVGGNHDKLSAVSSTAYLQASIKIAIALTEQLSQADNKPDSLSRTACDWASHVKVSLQDNDFSAGGGDDCEDEKAQDLNQSIEAFFESFEKTHISHRQSAIKADDIINETEDEFQEQLNSVFPKSFEPNGSEMKVGSGHQMGLVSSTYGNDEESRDFHEGDGGNLSDYEEEIKSAFLESINLDEFENQGVDEQLRSILLESADADEFDRKEGNNHMGLASVTTYEDQAQGIYNSVARQLGSQCVDEFDRKERTPVTADEDRKAQNIYHSIAKLPSNYESTSSHSEVSKYLQVDSAEIQCPQTKQAVETATTHETVKDERQRLFHLALVFYEVFSGGEIPPPDLSALAFCDGAFMSLSTMASLKENDDDGNTDSDRNSKRHQGLSQSGKKANAGLCEISCEYLKLTGVPGPLCNLIFNMLDCVYGDCCGKECYTNMEQVNCDLRLMMDKPSKYLKDDMNNLMSSGLNLDKLLIPREEEFESIKSCYLRYISGSAEAVIIQGKSGSGKTWLAQRVGRVIAQEGGIFLSAKFDQMRQGGKPFAVLSSAFDQYCEVLIRERETDWAKDVINELIASLGQQDAGYLIKLIPKLSQILDTSESTADFDINQNCKKAMQRLHFLFCQFIGAITKSERPVTLFLDDLQWADGTSIIYLNRLLNHKNFFFIGSSRDNGDVSTSEQPCCKMIQNLRVNIGMNVTTVRLKCMNENELNEVISDLLCLLPRTVRSLSNIMYSKTKGNILFFSRLLRSLSRDNLIYLDKGRHRWMWDEEKIHSAQLADDVALYFMDGIGKLSSDVQSALHCLSLLGSIKAKYIVLLESGLNLKLREPLDVALAEGLVNFVDESYHFSHDRILEASYNMMDEQHRRCTHLSFGSCLAKIALNTGDDDLFLISVDQINFGGPSALVKNNQESDSPGSANFDMAAHNMVAGKRSMAMSQFASAYEYFDHGISFLRSHSGRDHYAFTLEIFQLAAKCALAIGNVQGLKILTEQTLRHARCFEDELNTHFIIISSLASASDNLQALEKGLAFLSQLGENIPNYSSEAVLHQALKQEIQHTQMLLEGKTEDVLMNLPTMTNVRKRKTIELLGQMQAVAHLIKPEIYPFFLLKTIQMTLLHGLSPASPFGFACFGLFLANFGDIRGGRRFTLLARSLIDKMDSKEAAGSVIWLLAQMQCYTEPLQSTIDLWVRGELAAISVCDSYWACFNRIDQCISSFWSGTYLPVVQEKVSEACKFVKKLDVKARQGVLLVIQSTVQVLMGLKSVSSGLSHLGNTASPRENKSLATYQLYISFVFDQDNIQESCTNFFESEAATHGLVFFNSVYTFIAGLAAVRVFRKTRDTFWQAQYQQRKSKMELWSEHGVWNFEHKLLLFQAEESFCNGDYQSAKEFYKSSILSARAHKFIHDEALACELAAKFYLEIGDTPSSLEHFIIAHEKYQKWGAIGKANLLFNFVSSRFPNLHTSSNS